MNRFAILKRSRSQCSTSSAGSADSSGVDLYKLTAGPDAPEGHVGNVSAAHQAILDQLRSTILGDPETKHFPVHDAPLLRYLRARKWDPAAALKQYKDTMTWRADNQVDSILEGTYPTEETFRKLATHAYHSFTKEGKPCYWEKTGEVASDSANFFKVLSEDDCVRRHIWQLEVMVRRSEEQSKRIGRLVETTVAVLDLKHLKVGANKASIRVFLRTIKIDQEYYPERLGCMYLVNAPSFFQLVWGLISPFIDPVTKSKIKILGKHYLKDLEKVIDLDQIPPEFGGNCKCEGGCMPKTLVPRNDTSEKICMSVP